MIRRRHVEEEPHIAHDGTWCYFLSTLTLGDFDPFANARNGLARRDARWKSYLPILSDEWVRDDGSNLPRLEIEPVKGSIFGLPRPLRWQLKHVNTAYERRGDDLVLWPGPVVTRLAAALDNQRAAIGRVVERIDGMLRE